MKNDKNGAAPHEEKVRKLSNQALMGLSFIKNMVEDSLDSDKKKELDEICSKISGGLEQLNEKK